MLKFVFLIAIIRLTIQQDLQAGDSCTVEVDGSHGICTYLANCSKLASWIQVNINPGICSYDDVIPIICCPASFVKPHVAGTAIRKTTQNPNEDTEPPLIFPIDQPMTNKPMEPQRKTTERPEHHQDSISLQKCREYSRQVTQVIGAIPLLTNPDPVEIETSKCSANGIGLIVGGVKAKVGEFPYMAAIGYRENNKIAWNCGGTLISPQYVVTAAHCVNTEGGAPIRIRLGELNLESDDDGSRPVDFGITNITIHPDYLPPAKYNDIALIELNRKAYLNEFIRPACLWNNRVINFTKTIATGWGKTGFADNSSPDLLKVPLDIIENQQCKKYYPTDDRYLPNGISSSMLCSGVLTGGHDTCFGDSGGPLTVVTEGNYCLFYIIGVTSFGKDCGGKNSPGVYTRISSYIDWIESIVWR